MTKAVSDGFFNGISKVVAFGFLAATITVGLGMLLAFKWELDDAGYGMWIDVPVTIAVICLAFRMMIYGRDALNLKKW
ncbi:MAG: hypothetical protein ACFHHU_00595 [Porticoccaceae bacterium]